MTFSTTVYYLSFQDGRVDDIEYLMEEDAERALNKLSESEKRGICIMSYPKEVSIKELRAYFENYKPINT